MTIYRKIWTEHFGSIPKDEDGRSYEIHHIDGNRSNNDISNLRCVSIQEHYEIHYSQGDWGACSLILKRMGSSPEDISEMSRQFNTQKVKDGSHHFLGGSIQHKRVEDGTHHLLSGEIQSSTQKKRVQDGIHTFQTRSDGSSLAKDRVNNGSHNWLGDGTYQRSIQKKRVQDGTHNFLTQTTQCPHCNKIGRLGPMTRHIKACSTSQIHNNINGP